MSMRALLTLSFLALLGACASTGGRIMLPGTDQVASVEAVAAEVADADLVALEIGRAHV